MEYWYHGEEDYAIIGGAVNVPNSGQTYTFQESITQIQDALDPNGNTINYQMDKIFKQSICLMDISIQLEQYYRFLESL